MNNLILAIFFLTALLPIENIIISQNIRFRVRERISPVLSQLSEEESLLERGFELMKRESLGGWLKLGLSESTVLRQLGEPSQKEEDIFWGAIGMYVQKWEYRDRGIALQMESEKLGHPKQILSITISAPCYLKTNTGIGIGSSKEAIIQAYHHYRDNSYGGDEVFIAGTAYGGLIFYFENERVSQIFIGAAAE